MEGVSLITLIYIISQYIDYKALKQKINQIKKDLATVRPEKEVQLESTSLSSSINSEFGFKKIFL